MFQPQRSSQIQMDKLHNIFIKCVTLWKFKGLITITVCDEWGGAESRGNGARPVELMMMSDTCTTHRSRVPTRHSVQRRNGKVSNGHISRERPKSAVFPAEVKSKMTVEEQNERIRRNQSGSVKDKRRSLNLSSSQNIDGYKSSANYRVVRRRVTTDEVDIKDLEAAVRGEGVESPRQEIARLRQQVEPEHYDLDLNKELSMPDKVLIPERYLDIEPSTPLSPEEQREKQKKVERIKTLIAKSNLQNVVPVLDGPVEGPSNPEQQLHEQEKRIEISCALAAEASRRSRLLSAQCVPSPPASPASLVPPPSADYSDSSHIMNV